MKKMFSILFNTDFILILKNRMKKMFSILFNIDVIIYFDLKNPNEKNVFNFSI